MKILSLPGVTLVLLALLTACGKPNQRLDEYVFYDGPQLSLKVVRYYRNIPFNYLGEHAIVMCRSAQTADLPAADRQDAGWRPLGDADARGSKSAMEVAAKLQNDYEVFDEQILVARTSVLNISFDACGHFINWDPGRLPKAMIVTQEKPANCAPNGPVDCRHYDFKGERAPRYEQIEIQGQGRVSFRVSSAAFRDVAFLRVETRNNGAVWHVDIQGEGVAEARLESAMLRALPVGMPETGMADGSLMDWLDAVLPAGSMVIWPDVASRCVGPPGAKGQTVGRRCVGIRFEGAQGNGGVLEFAVRRMPGKGPLRASFHSGVYLSGGRSRRLESLADLATLLSGKTG
jgi:hypothetical protein